MSMAKKISSNLVNELNEKHPDLSERDLVAITIEIFRDIFPNQKKITSTLFEVLGEFD